MVSVISYNILLIKGCAFKVIDSVSVLSLIIHVCKYKNRDSIFAFCYLNFWTISVFMHFTNIYVTIVGRKLTWLDKEEVRFFDILKMFTIWRSVFVPLSSSEHILNCFKLLTKSLTCIYISITEEKINILTTLFE